MGDSLEDAKSQLSLLLMLYIARCSRGLLRFRHADALASIVLANCRLSVGEKNGQEVEMGVMSLH